MQLEQRVIEGGLNRGVAVGQALQVDERNLGNAQGAQYVAQVDGKEIRLPRPHALIEASGADQHQGRSILQQTDLALGRGGKAAVNPQHVIDPQLERGGHREVVHRRDDDQAVAGLQLGDQRFRAGEGGLVEWRVAGQRGGVVGSQRWQRLADQIALDHLGPWPARGDQPARQLAAVGMLLMGAAFEQQDALHAATCGSASTKCIARASSPWR